LPEECADHRFCADKIEMRSTYFAGMRKIMKTLYVSDLDGTLLTGSQTVTDETKRIINHLISQGMCCGKSNRGTGHERSVDRIQRYVSHPS